MKNVTANGYDGIYDGHSHGIEVSVQDELVKDEMVEYGLSWILIPEQMHRNLSMPELIRFTIGSQHRTTNLTQEARL